MGAVTATTDRATAAAPTPAPEAVYDAFISYRHTEADRKWALWLHRSLEAYRTPRSLIARGVIKRLKRVFRDDDELHASADLNEVVFDALHKSRFLIVVCSPRSAESKWVNSEISEFLKQGRRNFILPLLIEGEPAQSFPPALRFISESGVADEPLAADVRDASGLLNGAARKRALLKLIAPILGCSFDDLQQREHERTLRRRTMLAAGFGVFAAVAAGLAALYVQRQIFELVVHSQDSRSNSTKASELDATRSLLLSRVAFERSRRFFGIGGDAARKSLERALIENPLRAQFDLHSDKNVRDGNLRDKNMRGLAWHESGIIAAGGAHGGLMMIHGDSQGSRVKLAYATGSRIDSLAFAPGKDIQLAVGDESPVIRIMTDKTDKIREIPAGRTADDTASPGIVSWCSDGHRLAITNGTGAASILDLARDAAPIEINSGERKINAVAWNPKCTALALGGESDGYLWLKDAAKVKKLGIQAPKAVNAPISFRGGTLALAWNRDGSKFASAGGNGGIVVTTRSPFECSICDSTESALLGSHDKPVMGLAWGGPRGSQLASAGLDGTVRIWTEKFFSYGYPQQTIVTNQQGSWSVAWSPDGKQLATGGGDGTVKIWWASEGPEPVQINGQAGTLVVSRPSHPSVVAKVLIDGRPVDDAELRRLSQSGKEIAGKVSVTEPVAEPPDDPELLLDGRPLSDSQLSELARQRSTRQLTPEECKKYLRTDKCPVLR